MPPQHIHTYIHTYMIVYMMAPHLLTASPQNPLKTLGQSRPEKSYDLEIKVCKAKAIFYF